MFTGGISALRMAPKIAGNIKKMFAGPDTLINPNKKTDRFGIFNIKEETPVRKNMEKNTRKIRIKKAGSKVGERRETEQHDVPLQHLRLNTDTTSGTPRYIVKDNPFIRDKYYKNAMRDEQITAMVDKPFLKQLVSEYGNQEFMGTPISRLKDKTVLKALNLNRDRVSKELGLKIKPMTASSTVQYKLKEAVPDFLRPRGKKTAVTSRGKIKQIMTLKEFLESTDPKTKRPLWETMQSKELAVDPKFKGIRIPTGNKLLGRHPAKDGYIRETIDPDAAAISALRIKWGYQPKVNRFGTKPGYKTKYVSFFPTGLTKRALRLFSYQKGAGQQQADLIASKAKRSEFMINFVLDKLSPRQRKMAMKGFIDRKHSFLHALHEAARRDPSISDELKRPQAISTWYRNLRHFGAETRIKELLALRKKTKDKERLLEIDYELAGWDDDMMKLGLQSNVDGVTYGKWYDTKSGILKPLVKDLEREYPLKQMKFYGEKYKRAGEAEGGLINGHLTDTIPPERGPMPQGLPLLDPLESIDRSQRQHFQVGGFANLFGKLGRVPKAVGRFGDIKRPSLAKPKLTTEVVVGQAVEDKPAMFLSTVEAIEDMPDATNMGAQQWLGTIRNKPGVSATELDEFGLEAILTNMPKADPKQKLTKAQLIENYNREMPKIDMDIAIAEPVSRGGQDIAKMLLGVREKRGVSHYDDQADIFSNDARLLTELHQPPQDRVGFVLRGKLIDIMRGATITEGAGEDARVFNLLESTGKQSFKFESGSKFKQMWENTFPNMFHTTNKIVKQGYRDELATLVPSQDVTKLSIAKNISEEQAFEELYQALNIFDRQVMTADVPIPFWTKKLLYRLGDMSEGRGFFYKSKRTPAHEGAQFIPGGSGYGELKFYQNFDTGAVRAQEADYKAGHFSGEVFQGNTGNSPFGWLRFSERIDENGRKILLAEEIQSDLHQAVAQKGYNYAPRLDRHDVLAEMGEFAKQLDTKTQTLESTRLRKDAIKALPRVERESPANVVELKNIEKAIKKLIGDVKKLKKKVEDQARRTGRSGQVHPDTAFKKSENYGKVFMQGLMKMANDKGYDGVALSTGKMKKAHGSIPKGGDKWYDEIAVKGMKRIAKKSGFRFTDTTIVDGNGFTWEKIPLIELRDINTGIKIPGEATIPVYKKGGIVNKKMVKR